MISIFHLLWIIPLTAALSAMIIELQNAAFYEYILSKGAEVPPDWRP